MERHGRTHLFVGNAQLPKGTALYQQYRVMDAVLEIEWDTGIIVNADFTLITPLANEFLSRLIAGVSIADGAEQLRRLVDERFHVLSKRAILQALNNACEKYWTLKHDPPDRMR